MAFTEASGEVDVDQVEFDASTLLGASDSPTALVDQSSPDISESFEEAEKARLLEIRTIAADYKHARSNSLPNEASLNQSLAIKLGQLSLANVKRWNKLRTWGRSCRKERRDEMFEEFRKERELIEEILRRKKDEIDYVYRADKEALQTAAAGAWEAWQGVKRAKRAAAVGEAMERVAKAGTTLAGRKRKFNEMSN